MSISTARRRAVAATLAALLAAPLFACGAQPTTTAPGTDAPAADTNVTDSGKKDDAKTDDATGSSDGSSTNTDAPAFDTWSDDCVDDHGNVTVSALLGLKGWQLQTLLSQRGFTWNAEYLRYEDGEGRVFLAERYFKDGSDEMRLWARTRSASSIRAQLAPRWPTTSLWTVTWAAKTTSRWRCSRL